MVKCTLVPKTESNSAIELFNDIMKKVNEFNIILPTLDSGKSCLILHNVENFNNLSLVFLKRDIKDDTYYFEYISQKGINEAIFINSAHFFIN